MEKSGGAGGVVFSLSIMLVLLGAPAAWAVAPPVRNSIPPSATADLPFLSAPASAPSVAAAEGNSVSAEQSSPNTSADFWSVVEPPDWLKPLIGVLLGWGLGVITEGWRQQRRLRRYRQAIYVELRDVHSALRTRIGALAEELKMFLRRRTIACLPVSISAPVIFKTHFAETALQFSESERLALTHIYNQIDELNWQFSAIRDSWDINSDGHPANNETLRRAIQLMEGAYRNARQLDVMIELLLREKARHNIRAPRNVERLQRVSDDIEAELQRWVEAAQQQQRSG